MLGYQISEPDHLEFASNGGARLLTKDARCSSRFAKATTTVTAHLPRRGSSTPWQPGTVVDETCVLPPPEKYQAGDFDV